MIRVINRKVEEIKVYHTTCDNCGVELEYEKGDTYIGVFGDREFICPICGETVFVEEPEGIDLDSSNIEFPTHFMKPSDKAIDISDEQIQEWIRGYLYRAENDEENYGYYLTGSGNAIVFITKHEDEYNLYVTKKYWKCSIPR